MVLAEQVESLLQAGRHKQEVMANEDINLGTDFSKAFGSATQKSTLIRGTGANGVVISDAINSLQDQIEQMRRRLAQIIIPASDFTIPPGSIVPSDFAPGSQPVINVNALPTLPNAGFPPGTVVYLTTTSTFYQNQADVWVPSASFSATVRPVIVVTSLPALPNVNYPIGQLVVLTTDGKLYRNFNGSAWTAAISAVDLTGQITTTQISPNAITTPLLAANAVISTNIAAGAITAGKLAANSVTAGTIAVGAVNASDITTGTLTVTVKITNVSGSGVITDISQVADPISGLFTGIQIKNTISNLRTSISPAGIWTIDTGNQITANLSTITLAGSSQGQLLLKGAASGLTAAGALTITPKTINLNSNGTAKVLLGASNQGTTAFGSMQLNNAAGSLRVDSGVGAGDQGYLSLLTASQTNYVPVVGSFGRKIAFGAQQLSGGAATVATGLSSIVGFVATIGTGGGTPTEYVASSGVSGGNINVNSSNPASTLFFSWIAIGNT